MLDIACGANHSAILSQSRQGAVLNAFGAPSSVGQDSPEKNVYAWGSNMSQQLALPESITSLDTP